MTWVPPRIELTNGSSIIIDYTEKDTDRTKKRKRTKRDSSLSPKVRPGVVNQNSHPCLYNNTTLKNVQIAIKNKSYSSAIQLKKDLKLQGSDRSFQRFLKINKIGLHKHHRVPPFQPHHIQNRFNFEKETLSNGFLPELLKRTGKIYTDAVINTLTKAKMEPPLDTRVLLSDNAGWHKKDELPRIARANINQKFLPALSSDLNPIEHVWAMLTSKLYANHAVYDTVESLRKAIVKCWNSIPQQRLEGIYRLFVFILFSPNDVLLSKLSSFIQLPPNGRKQDSVPTINQSLEKDAIFVHLPNSRAWC
ncbi:hypothetical protein BLNAU_4323 [Blattamonas nauphoetae]|uniref:Tc1-like transposase DDE domain-containing protein n=1 Tax=Blattamonas nauphoetae TaxID=2049346 RepID=A0ABQ9YAF9_9EUKA|nr:hypothetical protein BLNAU_4323 [Blattamonas nauphoetae]